MTPVATRHLGLDLGATNLKWAVVEHDGGHLDGARPRAGADARRRGPGRRARRPSRPSSPRWPSRRSPPGDRSRASGSASRASTTPPRGATRFLVNVPGPWAGHPVAGPVAAATGVPVCADQRRAGLRAGGAAAGRGPRRVVHGRAHAGDRRRAACSPSTATSTRATTGRPARSGTRPSTRTARGAAAGTAAASRRTPGPTRSRRRAARRRPRRRCGRPGRATRVRSPGCATWAATSASASRT